MRENLGNKELEEIHGGVIVPDGAGGYRITSGAEVHDGVLGKDVDRATLDKFMEQLRKNNP